MKSIKFYLLNFYNMKVYISSNVKETKTVKEIINNLENKYHWIDIVKYDGYHINSPFLNIVNSWNLDYDSYKTNLLEKKKRLFIYKVGFKINYCWWSMKRFWEHVGLVKKMIWGLQCKNMTKL